MQAVSAEVADTLASITSAIGTISTHVEGVSAATGEQQRATGDILARMRQAASGVSSIGTSLDDWTDGMEERRSERRARVFLPAEILWDGQRVSCSVRDLTEGGARLHVARPDRSRTGSCWRSRTGAASNARPAIAPVRPSTLSSGRGRPGEPDRQPDQARGFELAESFLSRVIQVVDDGPMIREAHEADMRMLRRGLRANG